MRLLLVACAVAFVGALLPLLSACSEPALAQSIGGVTASIGGGSVGGGSIGGGGVADCGAPPGAPSLWVDGTDLDGSNNSTLTDGVEFDGTPAVVNKGSLGGTFSGTAGATATYEADCLTGSRGCMRFDGVNDTVSSSLAAASWRFVHEGDSSCFFLTKITRSVATGTGGSLALLTTSRAVSTNTGAVLWLADSQWSSQEVELQLYDGAAPAAIDFSSASGGFLQQSLNRVAFRYDNGAAGNDLTVWANGSTVGSVEPTAPNAASPTYTAYLGAAVNAVYFSGDVHQALCYDEDAAQVDMGVLDSWAQCKVTAPYAPGSCASGASALCGSQSPCRIGVMGNSITFAAAGVTEWPDVMRTNLGAGYEVLNEAVSSTTIQTAKTTQWANRLKQQKVHALIIAHGVNDVIADRTAAQIVADIEEVVDDALAAGIKVLTLDILPCGNYGSCTAPRIAVLEQVNADLAAAATGCWSHLAIYDDMEEPVATNDLAVAYDSGDGLHPNQTGQNAIEALVSPEVGP